MTTSLEHELHNHPKKQQLTVMILYAFLRNKFWPADNFETSQLQYDCVLRKFADILNEVRFNPFPALNLEFTHMISLLKIPVVINDYGDRGNFGVFLTDSRLPFNRHLVLGTSCLVIEKAEYMIIGDGRPVIATNVVAKVTTLIHESFPFINEWQVYNNNVPKLVAESTEQEQAL